MDELEWLSDYVVGFMKSPTWVVPIAQFVDDRCELFDDAIEGGENKLEYTVCHQQYGQLVGDLLAAHLLEVSVTTETFQQFCQQGLHANQELHRVLVELLLAVDDFLTFKAMMAKQNAELYREVVTLDAEGAFYGDEPQSPTRAVASQLVKDALQVSEWRLYEEQLFNSSGIINEESLEAARRCEEAELQHAIALSLQLEEEKARQEADAYQDACGGCNDLGSTLGSNYMPLSMQIKESEASSPLPDAAGTPIVPDVTTPLAQNPLMPPGPQAFPNAGFTSAPLMRLPHSPVKRTVKVEPLAPCFKQPDVVAVTQDPQAQALRLRAERALAPLRTGPNSPTKRQSPWSSAPPLPAVPQLPQAPFAPLSPPAPAVPANVALAAAMAAAGTSAGPTEEERRQRAAHLRAQRDRLLNKRRQDRGHQLTQAIAAGGRSTHVAAAVDRALQVSAPAAAGRSLVAELIPQQSVAAVAPTHAAATEQMRQALTVQLRQNLARSAKDVGPEAVLCNQLDRLEQLQAGAA